MVLKMDLEKILEGFKKLKVAVIGDAMLDRYEWGVVDRISPEAPAPVVNVYRVSQNLGGSGNVAANVSSLGAKCSLYAVVGNDRDGEELRELCNSAGIKTNFYADGNPTITKNRIMGESASKRGYFQQITRVDRGEYYPRELKEIGQRYFLDIFEKSIEESDLLILSDYNKGIFSEKFAQEIIRISKARDVPVFIDPKPKNIRYFRGGTLISPNRDEAEKITGIGIITNGGIDNSRLLSAAEELKKKCLVDCCTITCDSEGVFYYRNNQDHGMVPAGTKKGKDVSGGGDTFLASVSLASAMGASLQYSVQFANCVSGIVVEKYGVVVPTVKEIKERYKSD